MQLPTLNGHLQVVVGFHESGRYTDDNGTDIINVPVFNAAYHMPVDAVVFTYQPTWGEPIHYMSWDMIAKGWSQRQEYRHSTYKMITQLSQTLGDDHFGALVTDTLNTDIPLFDDYGDLAEFRIHTKSIVLVGDSA